MERLKFGDLTALKDFKKKQEKEPRKAKITINYNMLRKIGIKAEQAEMIMKKLINKEYKK